MTNNSTLISDIWFLLSSHLYRLVCRRLDDTRVFARAFPKVVRNQGAAHLGSRHSLQPLGGPSGYTLAASWKWSADFEQVKYNSTGLVEILSFSSCWYYQETLVLANLSDANGIVGTFSIITATEFRINTDGSMRYIRYLISWQNCDITIVHTAVIPTRSWSTKFVLS